MNFLQTLLNAGKDVEHAVFGGGQHPSVPQAASAPDITYNPNPNTNVPYSAHTPQLAKLGNQYVANPTSPRFRGVDPMLFGFPADNTVRFTPQPLHVAPNAFRANLGVGYLDPPQGGNFNPGYTPLQNSGLGGPGYVANLQPTFNRVSAPQYQIQPGQEWLQ